MGALSRRKGAVYERVITNILRCVFGAAVKRGIGQERAGSEVADVTGVPDFWVQTKHGAYVSIRDALHQAEVELAASGKMSDLWPLAVVRLDKEPDTATMRLTHFLQLIAERHYALQIIDGASPAHGMRDRLDNELRQFAERMQALEK